MGGGALPVKAHGPAILNSATKPKVAMPKSMPPTARFSATAAQRPSSANGMASSTMA